MNNGLVKTGLFCFAIAVGIAWSAGNSYAQDLFSGAGIRSSETTQQPETKSRWPKLLDFSKDEPAAAKPFQPFPNLTTKKAEPEQPPAKGMFGLPTFNKPHFEKPSFDWMKKKPSLLEDRPSSGFTGFSELMPKRDPNTPSLLKQMNSKSKGFFERTTGWAQRKNQNMREKSTETWDSIANDLRDYQRDHPPSATTPAQPPVRTAEAPSKSRIRF